MNDTPANPPVPPIIPHSEPGRPVREKRFEPTFSGVLSTLLKDPARILLELGGERAGAILSRLILAIAACGAVYGLVIEVALI